MPERVVLWDIDGTLISSSLERRFVTYLHDHGHIYWRHVAAAALRLSLRWPLPKWYELKLAYLRGKSSQSVNSWVRLCWEESIRHDLIPEAVEMVFKLHSLGARQVFVSGTPRPLAETLSNHLKIADLIVAEPEIENDVYTGRLVAPHPKGTLKATYIKNWLEKQGYDWGQTIALANHWDDRFLLERVKLPIAVNPDNRLRNHARRQGWNIVESIDKISRVMSIIKGSQRD